MYIFCPIPAFQVTTMAFLPGLKKQINKANQFMSEKISGVEGTKERSQPVNLWKLVVGKITFPFKKVNLFLSLKHKKSFTQGLQIFLKFNTSIILIYLCDI